MNYEGRETSSSLHPDRWKLSILSKSMHPITGERIAELLGISRPTIRSDLAVLVMLRHIDAKPKVGYFLGTAALEVDSPFKHIEAVRVKDVMGIPIVLRETVTVSDAVVTLFLENVGSLIVVNMQGV